MAQPKEPLAQVVAVLNMKGGVGKTTVSAHLMRHLFERLQKSTLLVDFDPQFNLSQTILSRSHYDQLKASGKTIANVMEPESANSIFQITTALGPPPNQKDVSYRLRYFINKPDNNLSIVPGHFGLTKYSLIEDQQSLLPIRKRFLEFIANSRAERDLICIDCNPSSSFMTLCALLASTHVLIPVRPDRYSILGLQLLEQFISEMAILTKKPKLIVLLNGSRSSRSELAVETALRSDPKFGPMVLANPLPFSALMAASDGYVGFATDKKVAHVSALRSRLSKVTDELKGHLGW
jgi:chromosome partitioning protein